MGVVLKKLRIRGVLSRKLQNLPFAVVRRKIQRWRKQQKLIEQRIRTSKRNYTISPCAALLLLLLCLGSILNFTEGDCTHHGWRAAIQFLNYPSINLSALVDLLCGFSLLQVLLSECWNYGMLWRVLSNKIWKVLSNKIQMEKLKSGDHIYTWRRAYSYAHHGIYAGNGMVIHYTRGGGLDRIIYSSSPFHHSNSTYPLSSDQSSVVCDPIDKFFSGDELYRFEYGVNLAHFIAKTRGGTCTLACSDPPELVLHCANGLLQNGFGKYHLFGNNCEDFAIYCKTGFHLVDNNFSIGRSGQVVTFLVSIIVSISYTFALSVDNIFSVDRSGQAASLLHGKDAIRAYRPSTIRCPVRITCQHLIVCYSIYSACRWASDIGIRRNASKAVNSRLPEEESSGHGVSIKFNSGFLKDLVWDLLVFTTWCICCCVLELTTEMTRYTDFYNMPGAH